MVKSTCDRQLVPKISRQSQHPHTVIPRGDIAQLGECGVGAAIVNVDEFPACLRDFCHSGDEALVEGFDPICLVAGW